MTESPGDSFAVPENSPHGLLRVLLLASFFPNPFNERLGTWAKGQAMAVLHQQVNLRVLSLQSYLPPPVRWLKPNHWLVRCPRAHDFDGLKVEYPRWLYYSVNPLKRWAFAAPQRQMKLAWWSAKKKIRHAVREFDPHVIFAHHTAVNGYMALRLKAETGLPFVVADWDFDEISDCEKLPARKEHFAATIREASTLICTSLRMERDFKRIFPGAPAKAVHFGRPPLPAKIFETPRPAELAGKTVILSASSFAARKGMPLLARAFAKIAGKHPGVILRIGGDGEERAATEQVVKDAGLTDRVQFLGALAHDRVLQEMAWCDFFALIGWDEPFATVFVEAMAAGKPIIFASDGGIADLAKDGVHGRSVEPKSQESAVIALDALLSDASGREAMGRAARELFLTKLTADSHGQKVAAILEAARQAAGR